MATRKCYKKVRSEAAGRVSSSAEQRSLEDAGKAFTVSFPQSFVDSNSTFGAGYSGGLKPKGTTAERGEPAADALYASLVSSLWRTLIVNKKPEPLRFEPGAPDPGVFGGPTSQAPQPPQPPQAPQGPDLALTLSMSPSLQRIWVRAQQQAWTTLSLIGSSQRTPEGTMLIARGLVRIAAESGGGLSVIDGRNLELKHLSQVQARLRSTVSRQTVVVLPVPKENPVTVSVAQATDAAILVVYLGETSQAIARQTIEQIGRERFLGTVIINR